MPLVVGEVQPSFPLPLRSRYAAQDVECSGTESSISQCSYNNDISSDCYVGNHSATVFCREGGYESLVSSTPFQVNQLHVFFI